jgi:hypothetical protein
MGEKIEVGTILYRYTEYKNLAKCVVSYYEKDETEGDYFGVMLEEIYNTIKSWPHKTEQEKKELQDYIVMHSVPLYVKTYKSDGYYHTPHEATEHKIKMYEFIIQDIKKYYKEYTNEEFDK